MTIDKHVLILIDVYFMSTQIKMITAKKRSEIVIKKVILFFAALVLANSLMYSLVFACVRACVRACFPLTLSPIVLRLSLVAPSLI